MKLIARLCAILNVALALCAVCTVSQAPILLRHPALRWIEWLRWPLAALWLWQGIRLWRNPVLLCRAWGRDWLDRDDLTEKDAR